MFHALGSDVDDWGHDEVEKYPSDELFCVQVRAGWEVVLHVLKTGEDGSKNVLNAKSSGP